MDWDEELKRQAAISALLAPPEAATTDALPEISDVITPKNKDDYHKLINDHFDSTKTDEDKVPEGHIDLGPPPPPEGHIDLGPPPPEGHIDLAPPTPAPAPVPGLITDPETGTRYVEDQESGTKVPYAEPATAADKEAFKPGDVTLPKVTTEGTALIEPAPNKLNQVERATLVKFPNNIPATQPWHPAGQKPVPGFIEDSQNAIANPAAGVVPPTPPQRQIVTPDEASGKVSIVNPKPAPAPPAPPKPTPVPPPTTTTTEKTAPIKEISYDDLAAYFTPKKETTDTTGQDNTGQADYFRKRGEAPITSENDPRLTQINVGGQKWTVHKEAAPYFQGFLQELADQGAPLRSDGGWNYRQKVGAKGLSEHSWAGAIDVNQNGRNEVTPEFQKWIAEHPNALNAAEQHWHIYGGERFGDLGHFEWGGVSGAGGAEQGGDVAGTLDSNLGGLLKNKGPVFVEMANKYGVDPKMLAAIAMEETGNGTSDVLAKRNNIGGITGPGHTGENSDYMPYGSIDEGIEAAAKLLKSRYLDQGLDTIEKIGAVWAPIGAKNDPKGTNKQWPGAVQSFYNRLGGGQVSTAAAETKKDDLSSLFTPVSQDELNAGRTESLKILGDLNAKNQNPAAFMKLLEQPISGVSNETRQLYADKYKAELIKYAQSYYNEPDPVKAYQRATGDANFGTFIENTWKGAMTPVAQADLGLNEMSKNSDFNALDKFAQVLHPESDANGRAAFIKTLTDIKNPNLRSQAIGKLWAQLEPNRQAAIDINGLIQAADNVSSPEYQAAQEKALATKQEFIRKLGEADPTIKGTPGEWWSGQTGQFLTNAAMTTLSAPLRTTAFVAQFYAQHHDEIKAQHPDWTENQVSAEAGKTAFLEQLPQDVLMALAENKMGPLTAWVARMKNPVVRAGVGAAIHETVGATMGAAQQVGTNIGMNRPPLENVLQSAGSAALQTLPFGLHGAIHATVNPHVEAPPEVHVPPEPVPEIRPTETGVPHGPGAPEAQPLGVQRPVTVEQNVPEAAPPPSKPWYMEGAEPGQDPLAIRGAERTTFTPQELTEAVQRMPAGATPEELRARAAALQPPASLVLGEESQREIQQAQKAQVPQTLAQAIRQQRAATKISELKPSPYPENYPARAEVFQDLVNKGMDPTKAREYVAKANGKNPVDILNSAQTQMRNDPSPPPPPINGEEPWISSIANKYTAERIARGEIGAVEPGVGTTKEEVLARGLQMGPEEVAQHVSDIMNARGGDPILQASAIRAEEARLSKNSRKLSLIHEADPTNEQAKIEANEALKYLTDFQQGPVAQYKKNWHHMGMGLQGEIPADLSSFNGLREEYLKNVGKPAPEKFEPVLRKTANDVRTAYQAEKEALRRLGPEIEKQTARRLLPTEEQVRENIMKRMKVDPCKT